MLLNKISSLTSESDISKSIFLFGRDKKNEISLKKLLVKMEFLLYFRSMKKNSPFFSSPSVTCHNS